MVMFFIVAVIFLIAFLCCLASEESFSSIIGVAFTLGCIGYMICTIDEPSALYGIINAFKSFIFI